MLVDRCDFSTFDRLLSTPCSLLAYQKAAIDFRRNGHPAIVVVERRSFKTLLKHRNRIAWREYPSSAITECRARAASASSEGEPMLSEIFKLLATAIHCADGPTKYAVTYKSFASKSVPSKPLPKEKLHSKFGAGPSV